MDEYHCYAYPILEASDYVTEEKDSFCPDDQCFNVEVECTNMYVLNAGLFKTYDETSYHSFPNISKDTMMKETTIVSWLCDMPLPKDCFNVVIAKILECANDMAKTHKHQKVLSMRACVVITRASEDETDEEEEDDDDDGDFDDEEEEDYDDHGLVPASKPSIEGLEMVSVEEGSKQGKCTICFEDFDVGVRMPCLHVFRRDCIHGWLQVANYCPLCRFQLPANETK